MGDERDLRRGAARRPRDHAVVAERQAGHDALDLAVRPEPERGALVGAADRHAQALGAGDAADRHERVAAGDEIRAAGKDADRQRGRRRPVGAGTVVLGCRGRGARHRDKREGARQAGQHETSEPYLSPPACHDQIARLETTRYQKTGGPEADEERRLAGRRGAPIVSV